MRTGWPEYLLHFRPQPIRVTRRGGLLPLDLRYIEILDEDLVLSRKFGRLPQSDLSLCFSRGCRNYNRKAVECPVVADLADKISPSLGSNRYSAIRQTEHRGLVEQSFAMSRLWFLDRLYPESRFYIMPVGMRLRGPLRLDALNAALLALEERHETLRTTFEHRDGADVQVVQPFRPKEVKVVDIPPDETGDFLQVLRGEQTTPFDLESEPGWRVSIFRLGEEDHVLSMVMHHIISDGWSVDILQAELATFYSASIRGQDPLSQVEPLPIQYRDFAIWQRQHDQAAEHQRQLEYWVEQLEASHPAELLCDKPRPAVLSGEADAQEVMIRGSLYKSLQHFCKAHQATPFVVLLAVFRATHYRLTGAEDATIGTPIANRNRQELEGLVGFFVNLQCMRLKISDESFEGLVRQARLTAAAAFANQDVPFERIVSELQLGRRDASRNPLAQVVFALHSQRNLGQFQFEGVEAEPIGVAGTTRFDLEFHLFQGAEGLYGTVLFATELYDPRTISGMISVFYEILRRGLQEPQTPIASLPLTDGCYALRDMGLIQIARTEYERESSVVDVFRQQVAACPDTLAVKDSSTQLTYAQLDRRSDKLACWLTRRHFAAERLIGVLAARSCQTIVAFLGILKANLAYLPLDVGVPVGRIETILSSIKGRKLVLLGADVQTPATQLEDVEFVPIIQTLGEQNQASQALHEPLAAFAAPTATSLAYVMFTSGSTGRPKGVMVEHRGIVRLVKQTNMISQLQAAKAVAHVANIAFDASTWEVYTALLNGGTLICIDAMTVLDSEALSQIFMREGVRAAMFTPALLKQCLVESPAAIGGLGVLFTGGDRLDPRDAFKAQSLVKGDVINAYGPTENTVVSTIYRIPPGERGVNGVPIGRAVSNSGAYVMDPQQRLVPVGVMGELVVTGDGVARGYTDPERDLDRFVRVTIDGQPVKAYRTGDHVRYRPVDGQLEFFGRIDQQVKIRGHRIELAEVEHALLSHDAVGDAVVVIREQDGQGLELVGFVTAREDRDLREVGKGPNDNDDDGQVKGWEEHFERSTYADIDNIDLERLGRDFIGWTSMYDGKEIDKAEMNEWLDDTIRAILNGGRPGNVFEVGTGTGMILFNLVEGLQSYVGLEPAQKAASFANKAAKTIPALADKVQVRVGTATDISRLDGLNCPNLVVVNSVSQYFPSPEYLVRAAQDLIRLQGARCLYFGDVRSYALYREFQATKVLHLAGGTATKDEVRRRMAEIERAEEELLVDPALFTGLLSQLPHLVEHVEILPKRMKTTNELSCYRYAAVVHVKGQQEQTRQVFDVGKDEWIDFQTLKMDRYTLLHLLHRSSDSSVVAVSNIPNSKTIFERYVVDTLDSAAEDNLDGSDWLLSVGQAARRCPSLSAADLDELARLAGFA